MPQASQPCRCRLVECGFVLSETSTNWPTCKPLERQRLKTPETTSTPLARNKQAVTINLGAGTHIDAPAHFIPGGRTVEQLTPSELATVPLAVVDVSAAVERDSSFLCDVKAIHDDEAKHGPIPSEALVCIRTGWAEARYQSAERYYNVLDPAEADPTHGLPRMRFPGVATEAAALRHL